MGPRIYKQTITLNFTSTYATLGTAATAKAKG